MFLISSVMLIVLLKKDTPLLLIILSVSSTTSIFKCERHNWFESNRLSSLPGVDTTMFGFVTARS